MKELLRLHAWATVTVQAHVAAVSQGDLDRPTPCAGWTLRALLEHMVGQDLGFAAAVRAEVPAAEFAPRTLTGPAGVAHAVAAAAVVTSFATTPLTEALVPEVAVRPLPLATVIGIHLLDTLVHGWDVSAALGEPVRYPDELVAACLRRAELVPDGATRTTDQAAFRPALAGDPAADSWGRTLRLLGRNPRWAPGRLSR